MKKILKSEWLKQKSSSDKKLLFFVPFLTIFISVLLSGYSLLESFSVYWWESIFLYTLIGLLFLYDYKAEEKAGHFQNIHLGKETFNIYLAKMLLKVKDIFVATVIFTVIFYLVSLLFSGVMSVDMSRDFLCLLLIMLASIWNLPFLYFLSRWLSPYLLLAVNALVCLLVAPFLAQTSFWYIFPYTYHYKIAYDMMQLKPSGDLDVAGVMDIQLIITALVLSLLMCLMCVFLLKWRLNNDELSKK